MEVNNNVLDSIIIRELVYKNVLLKYIVITDQINPTTTPLSAKELKGIIGRNIGINTVPSKIAIKYGILFIILKLNNSKKLRLLLDIRFINKNSTTTMGKYFIF